MSSISRILLFWLMLWLWKSQFIKIWAFWYIRFFRNGVTWHTSKWAKNKPPRKEAVLSLCKWVPGLSKQFSWCNEIYKLQMAGVISHGDNLVCIITHGASLPRLSSYWCRSPERWSCSLVLMLSVEVRQNKTGLHPHTHFLFLLHLNFLKIIS